MQPAPSLRHLRVRELLKRHVGEIVRRELPAGEVGLIAVNDVGVAGDLKSATVFVGIIGSPAERKSAFAALQLHRSRIQDKVAHAIVLKYMPRLRFVLDDSIERGNRVLGIIAELENPPPSA